MCCKDGADDARDDEQDGRGDRGVCGFVNCPARRIVTCVVVGAGGVQQRYDRGGGQDCRTRPQGGRPKRGAWSSDKQPDRCPGQGQRQNKEEQLRRVVSKHIVKVRAGKLNLRRVIRSVAAPPCATPSANSTHRCSTTVCEGTVPVGSRG